MDRYTIAVITPLSKADGLADTILDGLMSLERSGRISRFMVSSPYPRIIPLPDKQLERRSFKELARAADFIFLIWGKANTDFQLAEEIGEWRKTVFIDGSEVGGNMRYDHSLQKEMLTGEYRGEGAINSLMLSRCLGYCRREKPYVRGVMSLPFGIDSEYYRFYASQPRTVKPIDFACVFGQEEYPLMRRYAKQLLVRFCDANGFTYHIGPTADRHQLYELFARSKVGISIGGGGSDTTRFWQILGNNCLLLSESVDIFPKNSTRLKYRRILEFSNLYDFVEQLEVLGHHLRWGYDPDDLTEEYEEILRAHSSEARVMELLLAADALRPTGGSS